MARKFQDIAIHGPKYQDRDGKEKTRYQPAGKLMTEEDGRQWGTLSILGLEIKFSIFDQKERDGTWHSNSGSGSANRPASTQGSSNQAGPSRNASAGLDDDIPF